jgi:hypothetical protein
MKKISLVLLGTVIGQLIVFGIIEYKKSEAVASCYSFCQEKAPNEIAAIQCSFQCDAFVKNNQCLKFDLDPDKE